MNESRLTLPPGARVLVTGATGFTGAALVRKLVAQGAEVRGIARPSSNTESLADLPIQWLRGDIFDPDLVQQAVAGVHYLFHLATPYREAKLPDSAFHQVHVQATQHLAQAASAQPNFQRFLHISTVGVHGHIDHPPADETYPFHPGDVYQETKVEGEQWIRSFAAQTGLPLTVVRPAAIYGPGDRRLLKVFKMVHRGWVPVVGKGNHLYHLIHVEDLADFLIHAAVHPQGLGEVFICGNPEAVSYRQMVEIIQGTYQAPVRWIRMPAAPLFALGDAMEWVCKPLGLEPPIYRRRVAFFTKDRAFDTRKMRRLLDFTPAYSDQEGLQTTARWYVEQGWLGSKSVAKAS
jgi:dihydroflavonol-4-reductase